MTPTRMSRNPCLPRQLAEYESWYNARSFDTAASLVHDELFRVFPFGLKTLHHTLFHTLDVFRHGSAFLAPQQVDVGWRAYDPTRSIDDLRRECDHLSQAFLTLIDDAHRADLLHQDRRLVQVFHLVTHGTHHRTQFITMLRLLGKDAPFGGRRLRRLAAPAAMNHGPEALLPIRFRITALKDRGTRFHARAEKQSFAAPLDA